MPTVLAISSHVAASRVGLGALAPALAAFGVEVITAPTVVYGRHPGWGPPGGFSLFGDQLKSLLEGALAHPSAEQCVWAITGYFAGADQVRAAADALDTLKLRLPELKILVDPVMGDTDAGRYVSGDVPEAIARDLLPLADVVTPNAWEAEKMTGVRVHDLKSALKAARALGRAALISSTPGDGRMGALYTQKDGGAWYAHVEARPAAPRGAGDMLAGAFVGAMSAGRGPERALADAVGMVEHAIAESVRRDSLELAADISAQARAAVEASSNVHVDTLEKPKQNAW